MKKNKWVIAAAMLALIWILAFNLWKVVMEEPKRMVIDVRRSGNVVNGVNLQVEPKLQSVLTGQPVSVTVKFVNLSELQQSVRTLEPPTPMGIFTIVRHADGRPAKLTDEGVSKYFEYHAESHEDNRYRKYLIPTKISRDLALPVRSSRDFNIEVSKYYDMRQRDTYTVESKAVVLIDNTEFNDGVMEDDVIGNVVKVEVN